MNVKEYIYSAYQFQLDKKKKQLMNFATPVIHHKLLSAGESFFGNMEMTLSRYAYDSGSQNLTIKKKFFFQYTIECTKALE